jgi:hypothetical protein
MPDTSETLDRRKAQRFRVTLPVELEGGSGITRDISVCGVFFETDRTFAPGELIQFTLVLEHMAPGQPVRLQCQGEIVRVERREGNVGVAVAIGAYRLGAIE